MEQKIGGLLKRIYRTLVGFELKTKNFRFIFKVRISETPIVVVFKLVLKLILSGLSLSLFSKQEKAKSAKMQSGIKMVKNKKYSKQITFNSSIIMWQARVILRVMYYSKSVTFI